MVSFLKLSNFDFELANISPCAVFYWSLTKLPNVFFFFFVSFKFDRKLIVQMFSYNRSLNYELFWRIFYSFAGNFLSIFICQYFFQILFHLRYVFNQKPQFHNILRYYPSTSFLWISYFCGPRFLNYWT